MNIQITIKDNFDSERAASWVDRIEGCVLSTSGGATVEAEHASMDTYNIVINCQASEATDIMKTLEEEGFID